MDRSSCSELSQPSSPNTSTPSKPPKPCNEQGAAASNGDSSTCQQPLSELSSSSNVVARKESYKLQRKNYRFEKKKAANELLCSHKDPAVTVLADWLKGSIFFIDFDSSLNDF